MAGKVPQENEQKDFSSYSLEELCYDSFSLENFWHFFFERTLPVFFLQESFNPWLHLGRRFLTSGTDPSASWHKHFGGQHWPSGVQILGSPDPELHGTSPWAPASQLDPAGLQQDRRFALLYIFL